MEDFIRGRIQEVMPVVIADIVAVYLLDLEKTLELYHEIPVSNLKL